MIVLASDYNFCYEFAWRAWETHLIHDREPKEVIDDIICGKIGEIYARKLFEDRGFIIEGPHFDINVDGDGGFDIIRNTTPINVKTIFPENRRYHSPNKRVYINYNYDFGGGCEEYCLMILNNDYSEINYYGYLRLDEINVQNIRIDKMNNSQYLPIESFHRDTT